ncbi:ATP-binding protein [Lewinella sp. 4G2]|uniref:ATP-binding protein n=1 Tax=Lewinella sp. 4G2 TaxID=1803372 RepID=UPI0007B4D48A|nr:PAS domain-containing hybrid sensor histidine kinase/response regulator [Lewinella sp. 4G2]OAV45703.1 hypothetical protein A3850_014915 [Lewinella sp. 4G2]
MDKLTDTYPSVTERASYDLLPCGVICVDARQRILYANQRCLELLGYSAEEITSNRRFLDLLSIGGKIYFETHYSPKIEMEGGLREINFELVAKAGERVPVLVNSCRSSAPEGGFLYTFLHTKDRREYERVLKQAREKAEAGDRAKNVFLSSMSHEIRTPLHAILEAGNFLYKDDPREDQLPFINVLRNAGSSLLAIVNDILDLSKLESGMATLDLRPVKVTQLIDQVVDTYAPQCAQKGVRLVGSKPLTDVPLVMADAQKLLQVLNNLVSNAAKFTAAGEIKLQLEYQANEDGQHQLTFHVRDTGTGIAPDRLDRIFEPFVQAKSSIQADYGGTGLGLPICQRLLKAYGSELKVNSREGEGTEFHFTLLLKAANQQQIARHERRTTPVELLPPLNHLRVLNVDDNQANLLINARYFKEWKLPYDQFTSPIDALRTLDKQVYDLILLDLKMPELDGYELARRIRAHENPDVRNTPLIALSASASKEVSAKMLDAGINSLVVKPFEPEYLHHIIRQYGERGAIQKSEIQAPELAAEKPSELDFTDVLDLFAGAEEDYLKFLRIVRTDITDSLDILDTCAQTFDKAKFKQLKHDLTSTLSVFHLESIKANFTAGAAALGKDDHVKFLVVVEALRVGLERFKSALGKELEE